MNLRYRWGVPALIMLASIAPSAAAQGPQKGAARGFRLLARSAVWLEANRVRCGLHSFGDICADAGPYDGIIGATWPGNSPQMYFYNSGLQIAGAIAGTTEWAWAGDTTGGFFFDPKGTTQHGQEIEPIWNYASAADRAAWPAAARVPAGDADAATYAPALRGRPSASDGDVWWLMWEGDPERGAGRPHPLGVAVEVRGMGWKGARWNQDILYFAYTLHNITSKCPGDYGAVRPELRDRLLALGEQFQIRNEGKFGVQIPDCGYTIQALHAALATDMDVSSDAGNNYATTNVPMALFWTYEDTFRRTDGGYPFPGGSYQLPSDLGSPPFLPGYGFAAVKFLRSLNSAGGAPATRLYSNTTGGSIFNDPQNVQQLFRYLSGNIDPVLGDGLCNYVPAVDRICFVKSDGHSDSRSWQSTGPAVLPPGGSVSFVVAYVFASAVGVPGCPNAGCPSVLPGDPRRLSNATFLATTGANLIDSIAGFAGYADDNGNGVVETREFRTVRGSLMHKAQLAQEIFDAGFLLPSAPEAPSFFLVPGDKQVAVFWRPSASEATGDPFAALASDPNAALYDPNFRQYDVEGYRIWRGRTDDPATMTLVAQFDHGPQDSEGHDLRFRDYLGAVNVGGLCAPELGRSTTAQGCPVNFDTPAPGSPYLTYQTVPVASVFVQVRLGDRFLRSTGDPYIVAADTAVTGGGSGLPEMNESGVPFIYVDRTVRNDLRYFYAVTAFDINSIQSGPSSFESARVLKAATPMAPASNFDNEGRVSVGVFGRGVNQTLALPAAPRINSTTGVFSGPARPATGAHLEFLTEFVGQVMTGSGSVGLRLDSLAPGSAYDGQPTTFWFTRLSAAGNAPLTLSVVQDQFSSWVSSAGQLDGGPIDADRAARYGGDASYRITAGYQLDYAGNYYTGAYGRGCVNAAIGFYSGRCAYNGARWFDGAVETYPHPTRGNNQTFSNAAVVEPTNAGALAGTVHVYEARSYQTRPNTYRTVEGVLGTVATAADYRLYWGAGGTVDSVVDITHNVLVPFRSDITRGYSWGFLTQAGTSAPGSGDLRPGVLSVTDLGCVEPLRSRAAPDGHLGCGGAGTGNGPVYAFTNTVSFGPLAYGNTVASDGTITPTTNPGFGIYLAGHFFLIEMDSPAPNAPAKGTVWTMRSYVGAISGGGGTVGTGGDQGSYAFYAFPSPLTAVGASIEARYQVTSLVRQATEGDLAEAHTVPDPFYLRSAFEPGAPSRVIKFVRLPERAIIRIYTLSGVLVRVIEHNSQEFGGSEDWDVRNRSGRLVASGVYFYHIEAPSGARRVGRMTLVTDGR